MAIDLETLAPTMFSAGITEQQCENFVANIPDEYVPPSPPAITVQKVAQFAALVVGGIPKNGGLGGVADTCGITIQQARTLLNEVRSVISAILAEQGGGNE